MSPNIQLLDMGEKPSILRVHNFTLQQQQAFWLGRILN
jgi:hypothetical protein